MEIQPDVEMAARIDRALGRAIIDVVQAEYEKGTEPFVIAKAVHAALGIHVGRAFLLTRDFLVSQTDSEAERFNNHILTIMQIARKTIDNTRQEDGFPFGG